VGAVDGEVAQAAELEFTSTAGSVAQVQENRIGWFDELLGVRVVL
jgi:hypothetical protein